MQCLCHQALPNGCLTILSLMDLKNPCAHTASFCFTHSPSLQTLHPLPLIQLLLYSSSVVELDTWLLEMVSFYSLRSYLLNFSCLLPVIYPTCEPLCTPDVWIAPRNRHFTHMHMCTHTHKLLCSKTAHAAKDDHPLAPSRMAILTPRNTKFYSFPSQIFIPATTLQGTPAELSEQDHQASCPHSFTLYNFYPLLFLIFSSTHATLCLPLDLLLSIPSTISAYTQKATTLSHLSLDWNNSFANPIVPSVCSGQQSPLFIPTLSSAHIITPSRFCHLFLSLICTPPAESCFSLNCKISQAEAVLVHNRALQELPSIFTKKHKHLNCPAQPRTYRAVELPFLIHSKVESTVYSSNADQAHCYTDKLQYT